jgi:hypothetical protein
MLRLPVELFLEVFSYLTFNQLLKARAICRQWQQIILDSYPWPSYINMLIWPDSAILSFCWPNWVGKEVEDYYYDAQTTYQALQTCSRGSTKSLRVKNFNTRIALEKVLDVLPNFLFFENLSLNIRSISSHELTSVQKSLP